MSSPPVEPLQPLVAELSGKLTLLIPDVLSEAVAFRVNDPEPAGLNQSLPAAES